MRRAAPFIPRPTMLLLAALLWLPWTAAASDDDGDGDLLTLMSTLQTLTHKLQLSLDADNLPLAAFYAHEVEEVGESVAAVESYDGHPVGALAGSMLLAPIATVEASLTSPQPNLDDARRAFAQLVASCNVCHAATDHAFIVIESNPANPYAQSFVPR